MIDYGIVESVVKPQLITIDDYSVWVSSNISETLRKDNELGTETKIFKYSLKRYPKDEFMMLINTKLQDVKDISNDNVGGVDELGQVASDLTSSIDDLATTLSDVSERLAKLEGGATK